MRAQRMFGITVVLSFMLMTAMPWAQEVQRAQRASVDQEPQLAQDPQITQPGPIPQMINYQGQLTDAKGNPANGTFAIVFKIYEVATEGTALYTETQTVTVSNGVFNVMLGSVTPIPLTLFESGNARFLEITVNDKVMAPRRQFGSVPYAFSSGSTTRTNSGTAPKTNSASNDDPGGWHDDGTVVRLNTSTDNVGVGATMPDHKLTVDVGALSADNGIHLISDVSTTRDLRVQLEYDDVMNLSHFIYDDASQAHNLEIQSRNALAFNTGGATERMRITNTGNVGIGTTTPLAKLHVAGTGVNTGVLLDNGGDLMWKTSSGSNTSVLTVNSDNDVYLDAGATTSSDLRFRAGSPTLVDRMTILNGGNVGIGTITPAFKLDVQPAASQIRLGLAEVGTWPATTTYAYFGHEALNHAVNSNYALLQHSSGATYLNAASGQAINFRINNGNQMILTSTGNVGIGTTSPSTKLQVNGAENNGTVAGIKINSGAQNMLLDGNEIDALADGLFLNNNTNQNVVLANGGGNVGIGTTTPGTKLHVVGTTRTNVVEITGGSDLSEQFEVNAANASEKIAAPEPIRPGMVVCIDPHNPGKLILSSAAYDPKVAGIISGAGGINTGMLMGQKNSVAHGSTPVALAGRVYCWADASQAAIHAGDMLTTSDTPGHAMKVSDHTQAQGAILGKAMTSLAEGKGLVLVLVTLQ